MKRLTKTRQIALCGLTAAGSLALLWMACAVPSGRIGLTAAAGLFPMAAVLEGGRKAGLLSWGASSLLGLILLPDKGLALLYGMFLGLYPVAKSYLERLSKPVLEWGGKLLFFLLALTWDARPCTCCCSRSFRLCWSIWEAARFFWPMTSDCPRWRSG